MNTKREKSRRTCVLMREEQRAGKRGAKAGKMRSDGRTAARVNAARVESQRKCVLMKEDRRARMQRRSKAEKMPSDARTAACEYR